MQPSQTNWNTLVTAALQRDEADSKADQRWCKAHQQFEEWNYYVSHCQHCGGPNH